MTRTLILTGFALLLAACQQHSMAWDDAWAQCSADATKAQEAAQPEPGQLTDFREGYIRDCLTKSGFGD
jgi:hypothetical protein